MPGPPRRRLPWILTALLAGCGGSDSGPTEPPPPTNNDPVARIQVDPSEIPEGDGGQTVITLDGSGSSDPDGDALTFVWSAPSATFVGGTSASSAIALITLAGTAPVTVTLTVSDGRGGSGQAQAQIALGPPLNRAPTAVIAVEPTAVPEGDGHQTVVTLDGTASSDPDGDDLTFAWTIPGGNFVNNTTATSSVAQATLAGSSEVTVTLVVSDGREGTDTAEVVIGIVPRENQAPTAVISVDPPEIPQDDGNQTVVTLDGTGSSDPDGDELTFEWTVPGGTFVDNTTSSSDVAKVTLPGTSGVSVTLTVSDGRGGSDTAQATIGLAAPQNQAPTAVISASAATVPQNDNNRTVIDFDGSGSSDADGDALSYAWSASGATFENGTSATDDAVSLSFSGSSSVTVTLTVSDGKGGSDSAEQTISLGSIIERDDPSFAVDIQEIFNRRSCTSSGCHGSSSSAGLDLRSGTSYSSLVGVTATQEAIVRVIAGNAEGSYLVIKLEGRQASGARMPRGGSPLSSVDLANVKNWINEGAKNN